jgi:hypothetical protein
VSNKLPPHLADLAIVVVFAVFPSTEGVREERRVLRERSRTFFRFIASAWCLVFFSSVMRAIFLDIDGALNCSRTPNPRKFPYVVDESLLKRLLALQQRTNAQVILSLTWRYDPVGLLAAKHFGIPFSNVTPTRVSLERMKFWHGWQQIA